MWTLEELQLLELPYCGIKLYPYTLWVNNNTECVLFSVPVSDLEDQTQ